MMFSSRDDIENFERTKNQMELCEQGILENWQRQGMDQGVGMMFHGRVPMEMEKRRKQLDEIYKK